MRTNRFAHVVAACGLASTLFLTGCNKHTDKLRDISENPGRFVGKEVTVAGEVTKVYELPLGLMDVAAYRITDGTGQMWVLSRIGAPREGSKVGLKGRVERDVKIAGQTLRLGNMVIPSVIEETERRTR